MTLWSQIPSLLLMGLLAVFSACFSAAEAAFFSLRRQDLERLRDEGRRGRLAFTLAQNGERLLTAILFSNLLVNVSYFTVSSVIVLQWKREGLLQQAGLFASGSLFFLILLCEMLPKSLATLMPAQLALLLAVPIFLLVRVTQPILPMLQNVAISIRRIFWPSFRPEPYLRVRELEMAVRVAHDATAILEEEQAVLENLVQLSDLRAEEVMQPRADVPGLHSPTSPAELRETLKGSGHLLLIGDEDEAFIAVLSPGAILQSVTALLPEEHTHSEKSWEGSVPREENDSGKIELTRWAEPVLYVPWNLKAAQVLQELVEQKASVAAVVNEFGETIGVISLEDLLARVFSRDISRSAQFFGRRPIQPIAPGVWHVTGLTSLHRLCRYFGVDRTTESSHTVAGIFQEKLGRLPRPGDVCHWGPFELRAIQVGRRGVILAELKRTDQAREDHP